MTIDEFHKLKLNPTNFLKMTVVTGSMEPLIPVGASIVVDKEKKINENDIIVFWQEGILICHVVWKINHYLSKNNEIILVTRSLKSKNNDLSITTQYCLGVVVNFRLSFFDKMMMILS